MCIVFLALLFFLANTTQAQTDDYVDTLDHYDFKYKNTSYIGLHGDVGWNKSWFTSLGVSYLFANANNTHGAAHFVVYTAAEVNLATYSNTIPVFYGYKAGAEFGSNLTMIGVELRGYTDFKGKEHTVFMLKTGLSVFGFMNITYGYNIFQGDFNVFDIGHHQIALSVNIARKLFTESFVPEN